MPERTERGEEDRKREDEAIQGEPADANRGAGTGTMTRDKGVEPSDDERREGHAEGK